MKKIKKNKLLSFILASVFIFQCVPVNFWANEIKTEPGTNKSYVSAMRIKEVVDGLAPFDNNDEAGNDSNNSNGIVRSFDNINYTLEYVTELKDNTPIEEANLIVEFTLPCPKDIATFDMNTMHWIIDPVITEENGVQKLTGKRLLQNTSGSTAIPGQGILSTGIKVQAAPNGTIIQPSFKLWMEGNLNNEIKTVQADKIKISAAPKIDIELKPGSYTNCLGYFNFDKGTYSEQKIENSKYGRMQAYGIGLRLYNDSIEKGMKGIEIPSGPIEFDLDFSESLSVNIGDIFNNPEYMPLLWDYKENEYDKNGNLGKSMRFRGKYNSGQATTILPANTGNNSYSCYNGGYWHMTQNSPTSYHFIINDYKFSKDFHFPTRFMSDAYTTIRTTENIGYFSTGYIQVLCQFPENVTEVTNINLEAEIKNIKATSISNQSSNDVLSNNNKDVKPITIYPPGNFYKTIMLKEDNMGNWLEPNWTERGDSSRYRNQYFIVCQEAVQEYDYNIKAFDLLLKFDDKGFDLPETKNDIFSDIIENKTENYEPGNLNIIYATKKDGTGWSSHDEMINTDMEDLYYYDSIDAIKSSGKTCVGILQEVRNSNMPAGIATYFKLKIKSAAESGKTYCMVSNVRAYHSKTDHTFLNNNFSNCPSPTFKLNTPYYIKTEYDKNGVIIPGTHAGGYLYGNTILVKDYDSKIETKIADKTDSGSIKNVYDMDKNERTINFDIIPRTEALQQSDMLTKLYVKTTLPSDLTYIENSAYYQNEKFNPQIANNSDGSTTLSWTLSNVPIGKTLEPIKIQCKIGHAGTTKDVINNQQVEIYSTIQGDGDKREINPNKGNKSKTSFSIIKLNAVSISKETDTPFVNINQNFNYNFKFANNSQNKLSNAKIYDVLPYNSDNRNSKFHGTYRINKIIADFTNAPKTFESFKNRTNALQYTTEKAAQNNNFKVISSITSWVNATTKSVDDSNKTITFTNLPLDITTLLVNTDLEGFEYVDIKLELEGKNQSEGDIYVNSIFQDADNQLKEVNSNRVAVQIYGTLKVTKVWKDWDNIYDTRPDSLKITVYQDENIFKELTLDSSCSRNNKNAWEMIVKDVPLYRTDGVPYKYTIKEEFTPYMKLNYLEPEYSKDSLTVVNTAFYVPDTKDEFPEYKITLHKNIVNKQNETATANDFNKIKLDINDTYNFPIILRAYEREIINNGKEQIYEKYGDLTDTIYHGIVTNKGDLVFNIPAGKYELSEGLTQYFNFVDFNKYFTSIHATFEKIDGKYIITLPGLTQENEELKINVINKIEDFRPYDEEKNKNNYFKE